MLCWIPTRIKDGRAAVRSGPAVRYNPRRCGMGATHDGSRPHAAEDQMVGGPRFQYERVFVQLRFAPTFCNLTMTLSTTSNIYEIPNRNP